MFLNPCSISSTERSFISVGLSSVTPVWELSLSSSSSSSSSPSRSSFQDSAILGLDFDLGLGVGLEEDLVGCLGDALWGVVVGFSGGRSVANWSSS